MEFDAWEYPESCKKCGRFDNNDPKEPVTVLDANTKLCEFCFGEMQFEEANSFDDLMQALKLLEEANKKMEQTLNELKEVVNGI